ncbi:MAG: hypothetical protein JRJ06_02825 [Deltaproteobacteria bacterium]|nr:hypothetical protein [Deltaproteobacteria bacterium]
MNKISINRNPRRNFFLLTAFSIIFLCVPVGDSHGKINQTEILVIGAGKILKGNVAAARKKAISEALKKGVEEYLARYLGSEGMTNNFPRLVNEVIPGATEEVENFHILAEDQAGEYYKLLVRIKVNERMMEERLRETGLVLMEGPPLSILFLVSGEDISEEGKISYWWKEPDSNSGLSNTELALHRVFEERGFSPVNRLDLPQEGYSPEMIRLDLTDESAIRWGKLFSADVVIVGRSEIIGGETVRVILKALNTAEEVMIYQDIQTDRVNEIDEGSGQIIETIERAINGIASRLGPEIIRAVERTEPGVSKLKVELRGLKSFEQFRRFREFLLREVEGVTSVIQSRIKGSSITVLVEFLGQKERFLDILLGHEDFPFLAGLSRTETGEIVVNIK